MERYKHLAKFRLGVLASFQLMPGIHRPDQLLPTRSASIAVAEGQCHISAYRKDLQPYRLADLHTNVNPEVHVAAASIRHPATSLPRVPRSKDKMAKRTSSCGRKEQLSYLSKADRQDDQSWSADPG